MPSLFDFAKKTIQENDLCKREEYDLAGCHVIKEMLEK
jgi:hypothetical protein